MLIKPILVAAALALSGAAAMANPDFGRYD